MYKDFSKLLIEDDYERNYRSASESEEMENIIYSLVHEKTIFDDDCLIPKK